MGNCNQDILYNIKETVSNKMGERVKLHKHAVNKLYEKQKKIFVIFKCNKK